MSRLIIKTFKNEIRRITRNKKALLTLFAVPALFVFFMIYLTESQQAETRICLATEDRAAEAMIRNMYGAEYPINEDTGARDILITVGKDIEIRFDGTQIQSKNLNKAQGIAADLSAELQGAEYATAYRNGKPQLLIKDIATQEEKNKNDYMMNIVYIALMAVMIGGTIIVTIAADSIVGEKERGVYDGIVLSGAPAGAWFAGKQLAILSVSTIVFIAEILFGYLGSVIMETSLAAAIGSMLGVSGVIELLITAISCGLITTALLSAMASGFSKVKHASSYSTIVMLAMSFLTALPMIKEIPFLVKVPYANFAIVCLNILDGKSSMADVLCELAIAIGVYVIATVVAINILKIQERRK